MTRKKKDCTAKEFIDVMMENMRDGGLLKSTLEIDDGALQDDHLLFRNLCDRYDITLENGAAEKLRKEGKLTQEEDFGDGFGQGDHRVESLELEDGTLYAHLNPIQAVHVLGGVADGRYVHDTETDGYLIVYEGNLGYKYNPADGLEVAIDLVTGTIGYWQNGEYSMASDPVDDSDYRHHLNKYTPVYTLARADLEVVAESIYNPWRKYITAGIEIKRSVTRVFNGIKYKCADEFWAWVKQLVKQAEYLNTHLAAEPIYIEGQFGLGDYVAHHATKYRPDFNKNMVAMFQTVAVDKDGKHGSVYQTRRPV